jgi:tetratricopeptide (TPR) repeat protein
LFVDLEDPHRAVQHGEKALAPAETQLGTADLAMAGIRNNLSLAYDRLGRYDEGIRQLELALEAYEARNPGGPAVVSIRINLALLRGRAGAPEAGLADLNRLVEVVRVLHADEHLDHARVESARGNQLLRLERRVEAAAAFERCAEIVARVADPGHVLRLKCVISWVIAVQPLGRDVKGPLQDALAQVEGGAELPPGVKAWIYCLAAKAWRRDRARARRWLERAIALEAQTDPDDRMREDLRTAIDELRPALGLRAAG